VTVERFTERYGIDREQAARVAKLAVHLFRLALAPRDPRAEQLVAWAARLHELGMSVSHTSFHKHGAYILQNADMPGFSSGEQSRLSLLVYGCRGRLDKMTGWVHESAFRTELLALRLAVLFHHARTTIPVPRIRLETAPRIRIAMSRRWLGAHPLTDYLLARESKQWAELGHPWKVGIR